MTTSCRAALTTASFFALPQSPQLYKQLLMMAGFDRYVQVAKCFRDEDLRADRQPEFTQLDVEMSFVEADDVMGVIEGLVKRTAREILGIDVPLPLPRLSWDEAMERFGHDAPDLRYGLEIVDLTAIAGESDFRVFRGAVESAGPGPRPPRARGGERSFPARISTTSRPWRWRAEPRASSG